MTHSANISARRTPRQYRSRQTVEAVLAAVPLILKRHGAGAMTTNRIAEVAGVSIGSLYQYFPDKRSVFSALHERHVVDVRSLLERHVASYGSAPFSAFVVDLVEELVDLHCVDMELHRLISVAINEGPEHFRAALHAAFAECIIRCGARDMDRILFVLPNLVEGLVHGVTLSPLTSRQAKGEAVKATLAYLAVHPELSR
ncbi:TetR/AcrR family transcriptional regulator [Mesorhizobium sp. B2-3-4]|uniref:TetR/AcrR family transcriptional regulator n=1 Tax=Mesorhizobium sp. B2-3-4 TaxID=2589959 RepID=UPI0015E4050D|nr:TetR/AcrR family transcriptional regulator [Mesorhizobium sp. B2-3-4]